jgi:hypothetical protein
MAASTLLSNPNRHRVLIHPTHQSATTNPVESNDNSKSKDLDKEKNVDISDLLIQTRYFETDVGYNRTMEPKNNLQPDGLTRENEKYKLDRPRHI